DRSRLRQPPRHPPGRRAHGKPRPLDLAGDHAPARPHQPHRHHGGHGHARRRDRRPDAQARHRAGRRRARARPGPRRVRLGTVGGAMRLQFILSEIGIGLRRNISMAVSVVLVTFVSLVFVGAAALLQMQIANLQADWYGKVEVTVWLCPANSLETNCADGEATPEQIQAIEGILASPEIAPIVERVYFETKDEVFESFERKFGDDPQYADVSAEDMQSTFRVKLTDPEQYEVVAEVLSG